MFILSGSIIGWNQERSSCGTHVYTPRVVFCHWACWDSVARDSSLNLRRPYRVPPPGLPPAELTRLPPAGRPALPEPPQLRDEPS